jgi:hypothetical protein
MCRNKATLTLALSRSTEEGTARPVSVCVLHRLILFLANANGQERKRAIVCFLPWELRFCREGA